MGIFSKSKNTEELTLVFDIGSSSVGGALFLAQKSGVPKIIFSVREAIVFGDKVDFDILLSSTAKSLEIVANKICMAGLGVPKKTFCILASPWYASQIRTIKLEKNTSFIFTSELADSLIKKEISLFEEEYLMKNQSKGEEGVRAIELKNMKIMLNGYTVRDPLDKKIKELEMIIFISISSERVLKKIEYTIGKYFHPDNIKFSSFPMATFTVSRDMYMHHENFLLIDVGGEVTDVSMIKKDVLCNSISFPMGLNFMIRGISSSLNCSLDEAKSFISLYKDGHMEKSVEKKFDPIIFKLKTEWLNKFQESLFNLSNSISMPSTIFLTTSQGFSDFFTKIIKTEEFNQYTFTESKFRIVSLNTQELHGTALFKENVVRDPFIIVESVYINRFFR
ncbi:MAG: hypothetical protein WA101_03180 [Minisyncoccia bacterium]